MIKAENNMLQVDGNGIELNIELAAIIHTFLEKKIISPEGLFMMVHLVLSQIEAKGIDKDDIDMIDFYNKFIGGDG